jgi:pSer/pThr/pTyr-binding forkhead associated (FHA) protein
MEYFFEQGQTPGQTQWQTFYIIRPATRERYELPFGVDLPMGRSKSCSITLAGNSAISRVHVFLHVQANMLYIKDNGSSNKTYINGLAIQPNVPTALYRGSTFTLGDELFRVE